MINYFFAKIEWNRLNSSRDHMHRWLTLGFCLSILFLHILVANAFGRTEITPLQYLKEVEIRKRNTKGEVYLGRVMTLIYPAYSVEADREYHPFLLELTDVLKTPLRRNYRMVLKGYSDNSGSAGMNSGFSRRRAENLKRVLIEKYYLKAERITSEGLGEADPVASNETAEGRRLNRRVEIHIYGDVSEAVRFMDKQ